MNRGSICEARSNAEMAPDVSPCRLRTAPPGGLSLYLLNKRVALIIPQPVTIKVVQGSYGEEEIPRSPLVEKAPYFLQLRFNIGPLLVGAHGQEYVVHVGART